MIRIEFYWWILKRRQLRVEASLFLSLICILLMNFTVLLRRNHFSVCNYLLTFKRTTEVRNEKASSSAKNSSQEKTSPLGQRVWVYYNKKWNAYVLLAWPQKKTDAFFLGGKTDEVLWWSGEELHHFD